MAPRTKDIAEDKFAGGMDCRVGLLGSGLDRFRELSNAFVGNDNSIVLRPPFVLMNGQIDPLCQGFVLNNGQFYTFAQRGTSPTNTFQVGALLNVLYFDVPDFCASPWTLVYAEIFEKKAVAYIRHTCSSTGAPTRLYLHVWDALPNYPTYISDPAACWDWGPSGYPLWAYGSGTGIPGSWQDFSPTITPAVEKIFSPTVGQDDAFCAVANARVWNDRSADDIEKTGDMHYFVPTVGVTFQVALPENFYDFADYQRFAGYVLEGLRADGSWAKVLETSTPQINADWFQIVTASRVWSTNVVPAISGVIYTNFRLMRFRLIVVPEVAIVSGGVVSPPTESFTGDGATITFNSVQAYQAFISDSVQVTVNGNTKPSTYYSVSNLNGLASVTFDKYHQVTSGTLSLLVITPGTGYTSLPSVALSGGVGGTGGAVTITSLAAAATGLSGGSGYSVGDILTAVGGTHTVAATFRVTSLSGSSVASVALVSGGAYTAVPSNPVATTGGTGTGCTLTLTFGIGAATVTPGYGYTGKPSATVSGGGGSSGGILLNLANPVGVTSIPYAAAIDTDFGGLSVYINGVLQSPSTYTLVNAGNVEVVMTTAPAIGTVLDARLVPPNGTIVQFVSPSTLVSGAVITYEGSNQTTTYLGTSGLAASTSYLIGVAANGSSQITPATKVGGAQPSVPGTGYSVGDTLFITGGSGAAAAAQVTAVGIGGGVASVQISYTGSYTNLPPALASTTTGGAGTGCVLQLSFAGSWTGLQRYQLYIQALITTDGGGNVATTTPFQYGNLALTQWYAQRHQMNLDFWSGSGETGTLQTSTHDKYGGNIVSQIAIKNRMLICYEQTTQLWGIDPDPTNNAFLDAYDFGTNGEVKNFYSEALVCSQMGFLNFDLQGINFQALVENNVGLAVQSLGTFTVNSAVFFPRRGAYLAQVTITGTRKYAEFAEVTSSSILWQDTIQGFMWLTLTKESQIVSWSVFTVQGLTNVTRMIALDDRIYCLQGQQLWYFNNAATVFLDGAQDANGNGTVPYQGVIDWPLVPFAQGSVRMIHMDMVKQGEVQVFTSIMPWNAGQEVPGPILRSVTTGRLRVPLRCTGRAMGARVLTTSSSGMAIKSIRYEYMPLAR